MEPITVFEDVELVHTTEKARLLRKDGRILWVPKSVTDDMDLRKGEERRYDVSLKPWWVEKNDAQLEPEMGDGWKEDERG